MNALGIAAAALKKPIPEVGLTTFRPPYTPVTFGAFAGPARGEQFDPIRRTPIHDWAAENGAAFEDVSQWKRAWYFPKPNESMHEAVARECRTTRASVGLFDASTLGKIEVLGPDAATFLERMYANAFQKLEVGRCRYGLMLSEAGFLMDDGVIADRPVEAEIGERHRAVSLLTDNDIALLGPHDVHPLGPVGAAALLLNLAPRDRRPLLGYRSEPDPEVGELGLQIVLHMREHPGRAAASQTARPKCEGTLIS
jgi:hypothetical protein